MSRGKAAGPVSAKKSSVDSPVAQSERAGVYDALLFVSLGFLLMGMVFLVLELTKYGFRLSP